MTGDAFIVGVLLAALVIAALLTEPVVDGGEGPDTETSLGELILVGIAFAYIIRWLQAGSRDIVHVIHDQDDDH